MHCGIKDEEYVAGQWNLFDGIMLRRAFNNKSRRLRILTSRIMVCDANAFPDSFHHSGHLSLAMYSLAARKGTL